MDQDGNGITRQPGVQISFVVVARNDNYGGDFNVRMQKFINVLLALSDKHSLAMELVVVEWNPPKANPPLASVLTWTRGGHHCSVRFIQVPEEVHKQLPNSDRVPLFEYLGKNVGVRRAQGEYILVSNPDILFSEALIKFLAGSKLSSSRFYRTTRYDVASPVPNNLEPEELLSYCARHVVRINGYLTSYTTRISSRFNLRRDFLSILDYVLWRMRYFPYELPFTNASGDFMLMHRDSWSGLRGYPQIFGADKHGFFHADSFLAYEAIFLGLKQVKLGGKRRIFHQEHNRPDNTGIFSTEVDITRQQLLNARRPLLLNGDDWGLGAYTLPETRIL